MPGIEVNSLGGTRIFKSIYRLMNGPQVFALGLAKARQRPVMLICTSGTAAANFYPVVIEAHYSRVPLIVLTADLLMN